MKILSLILLGFTALFTLSCTSTHSDNRNQADSVAYVQQATFDKAKVIFYSLPSPVETAAILNQMNIKFTEEFINPSANAEKYVSTYQQAVNVGVYSADMCFCSLYEQNHSVVDYITVLKNLTEEMGIIGFFNDSTISVIRTKMNDKSFVVKYLSDSYTQYANMLEEQERNEIAALVLVGGWTESFYLALNMLNTAESKHEDVYEIIKYQKLTFNNLMEILNLFKGQSYIKDITSQMEKLQGAFPQITTDITTAQENELREVVTSIRQNFVK